MEPGKTEPLVIEQGAFSVPIVSILPIVEAHGAVIPEDPVPQKLSERSRRTKIGHAVAEIANLVPLSHPKQDKATILENAVTYLEYFNKNVTNVEQFNQEFIHAVKSGLTLLDPVYVPLPSNASAASKGMGKKAKTPKLPAVPRGPRSKRSYKKIRGEGEPSESFDADAGNPFVSAEQPKTEFIDLPPTKNVGLVAELQVNEDEADTSDDPKLIIDDQIRV